MARSAGRGLARRFPPSCSTRSAVPIRFAQEGRKAPREGPRALPTGPACANRIGAQSPIAPRPLQLRGLLQLRGVVSRCLGGEPVRRNDGTGMACGASKQASRRRRTPRKAVTGRPSPDAASLPLAACFPAGLAALSAAHPPPAPPARMAAPEQCFTPAVVPPPGSPLPAATRPPPVPAQPAQAVVLAIGRKQ